MEQAVMGTLFVIVFASIILAPFVGGYIAIKHGPAIRRRAEVRRMETAILRGQTDASYTQEAVENLRAKGYIE